MKKLLFLLILIFPVVAHGQNIRIQQLRSTGEPAGRIVVTDGDGSFEFSNNSYASDSTTINEHINNDNDLDPTNELIDSIRVDSIFLKIWQAGNLVPDSVILDSLLYLNTKIDSLFFTGDSIQVFQGGDSVYYTISFDLSEYYWSKTEITEADTTRWGITGTDDQTASEVTYSNTTSGLTATDVQAAIDEIDSTVDGIISTGGDDWGSQVVITDSSLTGSGTEADTLKVNISFLLDTISAILPPDQFIDTFQIIDNILRISLSGDSQPAITVGLASYLDNTDDQTIDVFSLTGTILNLSLEDDGEETKTLDLSGLQDGTGTDDQTASEVSYSNATSALTATDVQAAIDEIDSTVDGIISTGGDGWGDDVVIADSTLTGTGVTGDSLRVNLSIIPSIIWIYEQNFLTDELDGSTSNELITNVSYSDDTLSITEAGTTHKVEIVASGASGITALTGEVTASGSGSVAATVADNVIDYDNVDETLKSSTTNNTLAWDISANGIIFCTPSSGTVSFSNYQVNKSITVVLTLSGATISWPSSAKILEGSATLEDGTFYVYIHCISSSIFTVSITKEAS